MGTFTTLKENFLLLIDPWLFMSVSARHIPVTIRQLIRDRQWGTLLWPFGWGFNEALFGNFWASVGPHVKSMVEQRVIPLLEGRVQDGVAGDTIVGPPVGGVVMEVGAGTGMYADLWAKLRDQQEEEAKGGARKRGGKSGDKLTKVYGVEPNPQSCVALRQRVKDLGLEDIYEVVPLGIESLSDPDAWTGTTIEPGSVDCIVSILCLCSIPDQEENCRKLYELLKPGGRWYAFEHVRASNGGILHTLYQRFVNIFWSFFVGSCRLCKTSDKSLRNAGPWSSVTLAQPPEEPKYKMLPHVYGYLTK